jgi:FixJ family two-component response regulator
MDVISVVDDDESLRIATVDLLNSVGFVCEAFESAEAYLRSERVGLTSCLILDVSMPRMNGLELQRLLAQSGLSIPIIFITAFPTEATRASALRAGAVCLLPKPYADDELLSSIQEALRSRRRDVTSNGERKPKS